MIQSNLKGLATLLPKGYSTQNFTFWYGEQGVSKSSIGIQEACDIGKQIGKNVLYIRTEKGNFKDETLALGERFGCKIIYHEIPVWTRREIPIANHALIYNLFEFFGESCRLDVSDKGHLQFRLEPNPVKKRTIKGEDNKPKTEKYREVENECEQIIKAENIGVIIIDSFSAPLKSVFVGTDNLPARADCLNAWSNLIRQMFCKYDLYCFVVHHTSGVSPSFQSAKRDMFAQQSMGFQAEYSFLLSMYKGGETQNIVKVVAVRIPGITPWSRHSFLRLMENEGFRDCTEDELKLVEKEVKSE